MHRLHGRFDVAVRGEHDGGRHIARIAQSLQEAEAVEAWHVEIGNDDVGREFRKLDESFFAVAGCSCRHSPSRNHGGQAAALAGFVIHNENFDRLIQERFLWKVECYFHFTAFGVLPRS